MHLAVSYTFDYCPGGGQHVRLCGMSRTSILQKVGFESRRLPLFSFRSCLLSLPFRTEFGILLRARFIRLLRPSSVPTTVDGEKRSVGT